MVTTRRSSFSVPPLSARPITAAASSSSAPLTDQQRLGRKKSRSSIAQRPPLKPHNSRKPQRTGRQKLTYASPNLELSACLDQSSKISDPMIFESPDESPAAIEKSSTMAGHFLEGINVEKCANVLSIPDPPSPGTIEKHRRKRRQSSPFILEAFRLNEGDFDVSQSAHVSWTRSRKSICHFPSLSASQYANDWTLPQGEWENVKENKRPASENLREVTNNASTTTTEPIIPHHNVNFDKVSQSFQSYSDTIYGQAFEAICTTDTTAFTVLDEIENDESGKPLTSTRRESIVFHFDESRHKNTVQTENFSSRDPTSVDSVGRTNDSRRKFLSPMRPPLDWAQICMLIREYTSLSPTLRIGSEQAARIENITGYPLISPSQRKKFAVSVDLNWSSSPTKNSNEFADAERGIRFMKLVAPNIQKLEQLKAQEERDVEIRTNARVKKVKSKYYYYDTSTGGTISAEQYKHRYLSMLDENAAVDETNAALWLSSFPSIEALPLKDSLLFERSNLSPDYTVLAEGGIMDLCNDTAGEMTGEVPESEATFPSCTAESPEHEISSGAKAPRILPLPDIDHESSDPDIAMAERRLWAAMDAALETYSTEVMAILRLKGKAITTVE